MHGLDGVIQHADGFFFKYEAAGAGVNGPLEFVYIGCAGEQDRARAFAAFQEFLQEVSGGFLSQHDVHQEQIWLFLLRDFASFLAICRFAHDIDMGVAFKQHAQAFAHHQVVFDNADPNRFSYHT